MVRIANKNGSDYTTWRHEFTGSNTFAEWNEGIYAVYSYGRHFPLFVWNGSKWFENSDKYSVSTSKQQTQLRPHLEGFGEEFTKKTTEQLKQIIKGA